MNGLAEIERKLRQMGCPRCYHTELTLTSHMGEERGAPYYVAECRDCGFTFEVDDRTPTWDELESRIRQEVRSKGCPRCGDTRLELDFRCCVETRQCFHVCTCKGCGATFVVERYLEEPPPAILDM
jgi:transcription elongation factor Elf1